LYVSHDALTLKTSTVQVQVPIHFIIFLRIVSLLCRFAFWCLIKSKIDFDWVTQWLIFQVHSHHTSYKYLYILRRPFMPLEIIHAEEIAQQNPNNTRWYLLSNIYIRPNLSWVLPSSKRSRHFRHRTVRTAFPRTSCITFPTVVLASSKLTRQETFKTIRTAFDLTIRRTHWTRWDQHTRNIQDTSTQAFDSVGSTCKNLQGDSSGAIIWLDSGINLQDARPKDVLCQRRAGDVRPRQRWLLPSATHLFPCRHSYIPTTLADCIFFRKLQLVAKRRIKKGLPCTASSPSGSNEWRVHTTIMVGLVASLWSMMASGTWEW
jgi:hypothetical protein